MKDFKTLLSLWKSLKPRPNPFASEMHPELTYKIEPDAKLAAKLFYEQISQLDEADYGDFMRRANTYLEGLRRALAGSQGYKLLSQLDRMKAYVQYAPDWCVETTQRRLLSDAKYILDTVTSGHAGDAQSTAAREDIIESFAEASLTSTAA